MKPECGSSAAAAEMASEGGCKERCCEDQSRLISVAMGFCIDRSIFPFFPLFFLFIYLFFCSFLPAAGLSVVTCVVRSCDYRTREKFRLYSCQAFKR